jgi:hypothetical protein
MNNLTVSKQTALEGIEECLRCGLEKTRENAPYGGCTHWGTYYPRHLWGKTTNLERSS